MSRWSHAHARRSIRRDAIKNEPNERDARRDDWTREDLVTLESGTGPMVLSLERGTRGGARLLIEHHRENGPPIHMRFPGEHLAMLAAVIAMIEERES